MWIAHARRWVMVASLALGSCTLWVDSKIGDEPASAAAQDDAGRGTADASASPDGAVLDSGLPAPGTIDSGTPAATDAAGKPTADALVDPLPDAGSTTPPAANPLLKVSLGHDFGCGLRTSGKIACWGANLEDQTRLPIDKTYKDVGCGDYHCCAIEASGALVCVGRNRDGQRRNEPGPYTQVTAGDAHTCVLDASGKATCWGANTSGPAAAPGDTFTSLSAGTGFTCGIRAADASVLCWGFNGEQLTAVGAGKKFVSIDAAPGYLCGVTDAQLASCWSDAQYRPTALGAVRQVSAGLYSGCALLIDDTVKCWYGGETTIRFAEKAPFAHVAVGGTGRCAVPKSGPIICEPVGEASLANTPADFP
jgi:hypothetical protein